MPDLAASEFGAMQNLFNVLAERIYSLNPEIDISEVTEAVSELMDDSITAVEYVIREPNQIINLSQIDFAALKTRSAQGRKRTEAEQLKGASAL